MKYASVGHRKRNSRNGRIRRIGYVASQEINGILPVSVSARFRAGHLHEVWLDERSIRRHLRPVVKGGFEREDFWDEIEAFVPLGLRRPVGYWLHSAKEGSVTVVLRLPAGSSREYAAVGLRPTTEVGGNDLGYVAWVVTTVVPCTSSAFDIKYASRRHARIGCVLY